MHDPSPHLGDSVIKPLLTFGGLALGGRSSLNLLPIVIASQIRLRRLTEVAPVSVNVRTCVTSIEQSVEMLTVVNVGGIGLDFPNQFVAPVRIHRKLLAKVILIIFFRPGGTRILLPVFRSFPFRWAGLRIEQYALLADALLRWSWDQGRVDGLTIPGQVASPERLGIQTIKEGCCAVRAKAILKVPHRRSIQELKLGLLAR